MINDKKKSCNDKLGLDFVTLTTHELKSSLNIIILASQILLDFSENKVNNKAMKYLRIINDETKKLAVFLENLLNLSNLEYINKLELKEENITQIIRECAKTINNLCRTRNLRFIVNLPKFLFLNIEKVKFEILMNNLLSNATKNTPPSGTILINTKIKEDFIDIIIKDDGVGFTEGEKEISFKKFGKVERDGKILNIDTDGHGLGLYISKKIVELHGGQIFLESEGRNKGSSFIIRFPVN